MVKMNEAIPKEGEYRIRAKANVVRTIHKEPNMPPSKASHRKATSELYPELQQAYDYFNERLFEGALSPCLITLERKKRTLGYFSAFRFVSNRGELTHEIAMNPSYFAAQPIAETLSTLVHEQVHLWQEEFGHKGRRSYHNREWADKCVSLGLKPSDTGKPGGRRVGEHMSHYIIKGGPFDQACSELLQTNFCISWLDRFPVRRPREHPMPPATPCPTGKPEDELTGAGPGTKDTNDQPSPTGTGVQGAVQDQIVWPSGVDDVGKGSLKPRTKTKYRCPGCGNQVWGKPGMDLHCNPCGEDLGEVA